MAQAGSTAEGVHPDEIAVAVGMQRVAEQRSNVANDAARQSALMYSSLDLGLQARKSTLQSRRASRANCIRLNNRWIRFVCLMYLVLVCSRGAAGEPLAPTFEEREAEVLSALPFREDEFIVISKLFWWFKNCTTMGSYWKISSDIWIGAATRKAEVDGVELTEAFQQQYKPNIVHSVAKRFINEHFVRHSFYGVHRVAAVHPAEVKAGILALDNAFSYDSQVAAWSA